MDRLDLDLNPRIAAGVRRGEPSRSPQHSSTIFVILMKKLFYRMKHGNSIIEASVYQYIYINVEFC